MYTVSEAFLQAVQENTRWYYWTAHCLELKAYDYMLRFEKSFNGFEMVGNAYAFLDLCCKACAVELSHSQRSSSPATRRRWIITPVTSSTGRNGNSQASIRK